MLTKDRISWNIPYKRQKKQIRSFPIYSSYNFLIFIYTVIERKSSGKAMYKILPPTCKHWLILVLRFVSVVVIHQSSTNKIPVEQNIKSNELQFQWIDAFKSTYLSFLMCSYNLLNCFSCQTENTMRRMTIRNDGYTRRPMRALYCPLGTMKTKNTFKMELTIMCAV